MLEVSFMILMKYPKIKKILTANSKPKYEGIAYGSNIKL